MNLTSLSVPVENFFNLLCQNTTIGCWLIDIENGQSWWADSIYDMLGIEDKNETQSFEDFLENMVHPDERHLVTASIKHYLYHHGATDRLEIRLKNRQEKQYNWYEISSEAKYNETGKIKCVLGSLINIDEKKQHEEESRKLKFILDVAEEMTGIGALETNFLTGERNWSKIVYEIMELPYNTPINLLDRKRFFAPEDELILANAVGELKREKKPFDLELRLITANKNSVWIRMLAKPVTNADGNVTGLRGMIQKIERQKLKENFLIDIRNKITEQKFFLDETSVMSNVGGWEVDLEHFTLYWADQTKTIYEVEDNYVPTFEAAINFYTPSSKKRLLEHISKLIEHSEPFDLELEISSAKGRQIWVRSVGKPVADKTGKIIRIRGVIQDISEQKKRELEVNSALSLINNQNNKLKEFAYIVSHNLRSHTGNLSMITEMIDMETDIDIKMEWLNMIKDVSSSLNDTVHNLTGIVNLNTESRRRMYFKDVFGNIQKALNYKLIDEEVELDTDFSECEFIDYVPAYLESIMLNLVTNAIKYRHPKRKPRITLQTSLKETQPCLRVRDNGIGIDLQVHGNRLFKMNQTFHKNTDARGIGLFITKNQIESLGGFIEVNSVPDEGTTFTVHF